MKLIDILPLESIKVPLEARTKEDIIQELVNLLKISKPDLDIKTVHEAILEREKTMSTGIGQGIAIPHGKTEGVDKISAAFGIIPGGADFESIDEQPVYLFFLLASPAGPAGPHLRCLSRISRLLNRDEFRLKLIQAQNPEEVTAMIEEEEKQYFEIN